MTSLSDAFRARMAERAEAASRGAARDAERYGWDTRQMAERFGVSERTARRWRQHDRIPERRREDWRREVAREAEARQRRRMERRGIGRMEAHGEYKVSDRRFATHPSFPVKTMGGEKISAEDMRSYFEALDNGDTDGADQILNDALRGTYGEANDSDLKFTDAEDVDFTI